MHPAKAPVNYLQIAILKAPPILFSVLLLLWFQRCTIHCKSNSYITAANTTQGKKYGFVFLDCKITVDSSVKKVYLGRPWRAYSNTVFVRCELPEQIAPEGWNNWGNPANELTTFYAEYANKGAGAAALDKRVAWSKQLSVAAAKDYTVEKIFDAANMKMPSENNWFLAAPSKPFDWPKGNQ
ncbi:MAG: pectinesterase family protein [Ferruginibacter sp.]